MLHCINPLTIGYICDPSGTTLRPNDRQDGFISAILVLCFLAGLSLSIISAHFLTFDHDLQVNVMKTHLQNMLNVYMLVAIATTIYLLKTNNVERLSVLDLVRQPRVFTRCASVNRIITGVQRFFRNSVTLFGLGTLTVLSVLMDAFRVSCHLSCIVSLSGCSLIYQYITRVAFCLVRCTLLGMQAVFCMQFYHRTFVRSVLVRYSLVLILAASISNWFNSILYDSLGNQDYKTNCTNTTTDVKECLNESTPCYSAIEYVTSPIHPISLRIQILLLSAQILLRLFFSTVDSTTLKKLKELQLSSQENAHDVNDPPQVLHTTCINVVTDDVVIGHDRQSARLIDTDPKDHWRRFHVFLQKTRHAVPVFLATILFPHIVIAHLDATWLGVYLIYTYSMLLTAITLSVLALGSTRGLPPRDKRPLNCFELTACMMTVGFTIHISFIFIAAGSLLRAPNKIDRTLYLTIFGALAASFQVITQTEAMMHIGRLRLMSRQEISEAGDPNNFKSRCQRTLVRHYVLAMALLNLTMWISDSGVLKEKAEVYLSVLERFYQPSHWNMIQHVSRPLVLFYRFSCSLIFFKMYFRGG